MLRCLVPCEISYNMQVDLHMPLRSGLHFPRLTSQMILRGSSDTAASQMVPASNRALLLESTLLSACSGVALNAGESLRSPMKILPHLPRLPCLSLGVSPTLVTAVWCGEMEGSFSPWKSTCLLEVFPPLTQWECHDNLSYVVKPVYVFVILTWGYHREGCGTW